MLASETVPSVEDAETPWCYRYPAGYCYARFHRTTIHCDVLPTHMTDTSPLRPTMTYGEHPIRGPHLLSAVSVTRPNIRTEQPKRRSRRS